MKYIVSKDNDLVIFSEGFKHSEVADKLRIVPVSAGFIDQNLKPYGKSFTLGLSAMEKDQRIINNHFNKYE